MYQSLVAWLLFSSVGAFEWSTGPHPELDKWAIAGLWRLTPRPSPMKEFTVYPKRPLDKVPELLLMLKEDGSFQRYNSEEEMDADVSEQWNKYQQAQKREQLQDDLRQGVWDYVDGKLILAADRPEDKLPKSTELPLRSSVNKKDTLLVGRVVATYGTSLLDNPVAGSNTTMTESISKPGMTRRATPIPQKSSVDTHLSVPKGSVKVGRFMYPKTHPSFFEQPMFQPMRQGFFTFQQVLGNLNARNREEEQIIERYDRRDFYNKTFMLTSHPIPTRQPKGRQRWSIKYNKFVEDPPSAAAKKAQEEEKNRGVPIRVMQVQFFANNTFSTVAGLGESILRGKFDVIGHEKDQLWMQIWRFGFGRSVSGSVYSEGKHLTHEDAKTYWGTIKPEGSDDASDESSKPKEDDAGKPGRLEVKGSVMFGWGLEPMPVARFIMREMQEDEAILEDEEEEDEEGYDDDLPDLRVTDVDETSGDGIDWSGDDGSTFQ